MIKIPYVRPFLSSDTAGVYKIAADTAFFGEPVEIYFDDRRLFNDAFYQYYSLYEPEYGWIALANEQVVGFLLGCVNTGEHQHMWFRKIFPGLIVKVFRGRYRMGTLTLHYIFSLINGYLRHEFPKSDLKLYPAHLHINIDKEWRGCGLGRHLTEAYLSQLRQLSVPGVHLNTTSENEAAIHLYTRMGFKLLEARQTKTWERYVPRPVVNLCYGLRLD